MTIITICGKSIDLNTEEGLEAIKAMGTTVNKDVTLTNQVGLQVNKTTKEATVDFNEALGIVNLKADGSIETIN